MSILFIFLKIHEKINYLFNKKNFLHYFSILFFVPLQMDKDIAQLFFYYNYYYNIK